MTIDLEDWGPPTRQQLEELRRLSSEPRRACSSAIARVQSGLVRRGMAERDGDVCTITERGLEELRGAHAYATKRLRYWGERIGVAEQDERDAEAKVAALKLEMRTLDWRSKRGWDELTYHDVQRRYALPELIGSAERELDNCRVVLAERWLRAKRWWREDARRRDTPPGLTSPSGSPQSAHSTG